jgi:hypothetical protein
MPRVEADGVVKVLTVPPWIENDCTRPHDATRQAVRSAVRILVMGFGCSCRTPEFPVTSKLGSAPLGASPLSGSRKRTRSHRLSRCRWTTLYIHACPALPLAPRPRVPS